MRLLWLAGWLWGSGHVDLTSSVKRLASDESQRRAAEGRERRVRRGLMERKTGVCLGWGLPLWALVLWSERVFGSVSGAGRGRSRSFRNPLLCCCGWPTHSQSLSEPHARTHTHARTHARTHAHTHTHTHTHTRSSDWATVKHLFSSHLFHHIKSRLSWLGPLLLYSHLFFFPLSSPCLFICFLFFLCLSSLLLCYFIFFNFSLLIVYLSSYLFSFNISLSSLLSTYLFSPVLFIISSWLFLSSHLISVFSSFISYILICSFFLISYVLLSSLSSHCF